MDMNPRGAWSGGRGRGRGERIRHNWDRASSGDLNTPTSALRDAKPDSSNNWGQHGVSQGSSVGASSQVAVNHENRNRGSFGGLTNPASDIGERKPDSANTNGVSQVSSVGASSQVAVNYQSRNRGSFGGLINPASAFGEVESDFVKRVGQGRAVRHENFATSNRGSVSNRGRGGQGRRWNEDEQSEDARINALGRTLVRILRHQAFELGLRVRDDGFTEVKGLLRLSIRTGVGLPLSSHTIQDFYQVVKQDYKQRLGIIKEDEKVWIRANQGHSLKIIDSDKLLKPIENADEIKVCVHGTYMHFLPSILSEGLRTMNRIHVHFAPGLPKDNGVISGTRQTCEVLIYLDVARALSDKMKLYISENGVILTEGFGGVVPPDYFAKIIKWPEGTQIPLQKLKNPASLVHDK